jgi:tetratricopeptide (TPR) repeat protein
MSAGSQLEKAIASERSGDLAGAMAGYQKVLRKEPSNIDALFLLGRGHCQQGQLEAGAQLFRKIVTLRPDHGPAHTLLGRVLSDTGRPQEALGHFERAAALDPNNGMAVLGRAVTLLSLARHAEAVAAFDQALALAPNDAFAWTQRGLALAALGRDGEAAESLERAAALMPEVGGIHFNLANVLQRLGRHEDAVARYRRALALQADLVWAHANMGNSLLALGRWQEAHDCLARALTLVPPSAQLHHGMGVALSQLGRYEEGLASYDKALALAPGQPNVLGDKGRLLWALGRIEEARAAIEQAIAADPSAAGLYPVLREVAAFAPGDSRIAAMEALLANGQSLTGEQRSDLNFTLAKAYADVGDRERAFSHLAEANALKRKLIDYDESATLARYGRIAEVFTPALMRDKVGAGSASELPVFIIGMPRSGTTLVEQILASLPGVHAGGEREDFQEALIKISGRGDYPEQVAAMTRADLAALGAAYVESVAATAPQALRFVDKMPANYLYAGLIHLALPNARIIHVQRDPVDTCLSCFETPFRTSQKFAYDLGELGRLYRAYAQLMAHWRAVLPAEAMLEVQYESLVADFESEARRLVAYCGLPWDEACLAFHETRRPVLTASATQVRQPLYQSSVGRWRAYRAPLQPLLEALGRTAEE